MSRKIPKLIAVEGIIGSGKTHLICNRIPNSTHFMNKKMKTIEEPIDCWLNPDKFPRTFYSKYYKNAYNRDVSNGNYMNYNDNEFSLFEEMYHNPERWGFTFQLWALFTRIETLNNAIKDIKQNDLSCDYIFIERSAFANYLFASVKFQNNELNHCEWLMYNHYFEYFSRNAPSIDGIIYMDCNINTCMERIKKRQRKGEELIKDTYLQQLKAKHNEWINDIIKTNEINVLTIKGPYDDKLKSTMDDIQSFMDILSHKTQNFIA